VLRKFIKIRGVGRFLDYRTRGDTELRGVNIIYAENGKGKTTLVAVLKSLKLNDPSWISRRRTFKYTGAQEVEILSDQSHLFQDNQWNSPKPDVEIFDTYFVNDNVYYGYEVSPGNKKSLHNYVVGEEGVNLSSQINDLKQGIDETNKQIRELSLRLEQARGPVPLSQFISLQKEPDLETKLKNKEKEIKIAEAAEMIRKKECLKELAKLHADTLFSEVKEPLFKVIRSISQSAIDRVEEHKKHLSDFMSDGPEEWIEKGYEAARIEGYGNACPFCAQDLGVSEILRAYEQYFNVEYNNLKQSVESYKKFFREGKLELEINSRELIASNNETLVEFWKEYLEIDPQTGDPFSNKVRLVEKWGRVGQTFQAKIENLLEEGKGEPVDELEKELKYFNEGIDSYNKWVQSVNKQIVEVQGRSPASLLLLRKELEELEARARRFQEPFDTLCNNYNEAKSDLAKKNEAKEIKQTELAKYSEAIFREYGQKINEYLKKFNVEFEIGKIEGGFKGLSKEPYAEYAIRMAGEDIKFENDDGSYSVKHTLSEGDKSTLALAFFLARLHLDPNLKDKLLILDDPLSSLDTSRRSRTIECICDLSGKVKQTIVLSHNDNFVYKLFISNEFRGAQTLQIIDNGIIAPWDLEGAMQHEYFATLAKIESYMADGSSLTKDQAKRLIRIALENDLKFRFHRVLKKPAVTPDGRTLEPVRLGTNLGTMIEKLRYSPCSFRESDKELVIKELFRLNDYSRPSQHGTADHPFTGADDDVSEIQTYLKSTLDIIENKL